jgi:hypothetical protein
VTTLGPALNRAARHLGQLHFSWHGPLFRAGQAVLQGRLDEGERLAAEALALGRRAHDPMVAIYHMIVLIGLRWGQGRLPELETTLRRFVDRSQPTSAGGRRSPCCSVGPAPALCDRNILVARLPLARLVRRRTTSGCWPRPWAAGTTRLRTFRSPWPPTTACVPPPFWSAAVSTTHGCCIRSPGIQLATRRSRGPPTEWCVNTPASRSDPSR